jgi:hypothetical protein
MIANTKKFSYFLLKRFFFIFTLSVLFITCRTHYLCNKLYEFETCRESIDFMIQHKTTFLMIYKFNRLQESIKSHFYGQPKRSYYEALSDWVEARIMDHIERKDAIRSVNDLPWLERNAIKALDGSSWVSRIYQQILSYITGARH